MIKTLYILWFQGIKTHPYVVKNCILSWKLKNPDWNIIILDNNNIKDYINVDEYIDTKKINITLTGLSDIVRILLLKKYGGLWVDSTTFCNLSLTRWLPTKIRTGFFAFSKPFGNHLLSSWFLYSEKDNYIINKLYDEIKIFWTINNKTNNYYWFHGLFGQIYKKDIKFRRIWNNTPKISSKNCHRFNLNFNRPIKLNEIYIVNSKTEFVYKLTYKYKKLVNNSVFHYLFSTLNPLKKIYMQQMQQMQKIQDIKNI